MPQAVRDLAGERADISLNCLTLRLASEGRGQKGLTKEWAHAS